MELTQRNVALVACLIYALSLLDAGLTLLILERGGTELNPVMDFFLQMGVFPFILIKSTLTALGLTILFQLRNQRLAGWFPAGRFLVLLSVAYLVLILWEGKLLLRSLA